MAHRHDQERAIIAMDAQLDLGDERQQGAAPVAADGSLRIARGAGGVHQHPWVGRQHALIGFAVAGCPQKVFVGVIAGRAGALAEMDEAAVREG